MHNISGKKTPQHVAIIMDGNGRWAKNHDLPRGQGHSNGMETARKIVRFAAEAGISVLTLFAFGRENWQRPEEEVEIILGLLLATLYQEIDELHRHNVQLKVIGNHSAFSEELRQQIIYTQNLTKKNTGLTLVIAVDYSGQWDITEAFKKIAASMMKGELSIDDITPRLIESFLELANLPHPDLFIRTSGEQRISNFYLWQLAYTELYFTPKHWPDFDEEEFAKALAFFSSRQRRFGLTGDQINAKENRGE